MIVFLILIINNLLFNLAGTPAKTNSQKTKTTEKHGKPHRKYQNKSEMMKQLWLIFNHKPQKSRVQKLEKLPKMLIKS